VAGMVISTALHWGAAASIIISVVLAFGFGYWLTVRSLRNSLDLQKAAKVALASDTASITVMEITDNAFILIVPGAINASLDTGLFWLSLSVSLILAFAAAFPVNRYLIQRGKGHACVHSHH
jgi:Zn-dependent protease